MIEINIPGRDILRIEHLVLDYNGTIAVDGALIEGIQERLQRLLLYLSRLLRLYQLNMHRQTVHSA